MAIPAIWRWYIYSRHMKKFLGSYDAHRTLRHPLFASFQAKRTPFKHSRAFLKWALAVASGFGIAHYATPRRCGHRHIERSAETSQGGRPSRSLTGSHVTVLTPKDVNNLVFADMLDETRNATKGDKECRPWHGLFSLSSAPSLDELRTSLSSWSWPERLAPLGEKAQVLLLELSRGPGSLYSHVMNDPPDPTIYPECQWDAEVRLGDDLCVSERAFLRMRKRKMRRAFAKLFNIDESEIDERDLPIVAIAGSGGGFRAMLNTTGSLIGAEKTGILDCITYLSGISGSCWALGVLYSGVSGTTAPKIVAEHIAKRIATSYVDASVLDMLTTAPTNKYLLAGILRKANSPVGSPSLVDLYGMLLSARLFIPDDLARLDPRYLSLHHFRRNIDDGSLPLPIFTAVLHEIPTDLEKTLAETESEEKISLDLVHARTAKREEEEFAERANWLWFEFTPYEVGCDEIGAWIPTWSLGRMFEKGKSSNRAPELSFSILVGVFASAFCASLKHYINEVQPILRQFPAQLNNWITEIVTEKKREIGILHPVEPNEIPNFVKGLAGLLREGSPPNITERDTLGFMDAGVELNVPYYPLFRRNVDCIIALDASADSQDLWFTRAEQLATRRGLSTWPKGARWPALIQSKPRSEEEAAVQKATSEMTSPPKSPSEVVNRALAAAQETEASGQAHKVGDRSEAESFNHEAFPNGRRDGEGEEEQINPNRYKKMSASTIWMGSSAGVETGQSTLLEKIEEQDLMHRDGLAIVYNPLIANDAVPGFEPMSVSTWTFSLNREESEKLLKVAEANFEEGQEKTVKLLKAIWLRKKAVRERRENEMLVKRYTRDEFGNC